MRAVTAERCEYPRGESTPEVLPAPTEHSGADPSAADAQPLDSGALPSEQDYGGLGKALRENPIATIFKEFIGRQLQSLHHSVQVRGETFHCAIRHRVFKTREVVDAHGKGPTRV